MRRDLDDVGTLANDTSAQANINGNSDTIERTARASLSKYPLNADGTVNASNATLDADVGNAMQTSLDMNTQNIQNAGNITCTTMTINGTNVVPSSVASFTASADQVTFVPYGNIAGTDVEAALQELDDEKQPLDATLTAVAGLTVAANKIILADGADSFTTIDFLDEDNMASDSATAAASQQSIKAYVDAVGSPYPIHTLNGCIISNNTTDATNDIDVSAGAARDAADSTNLATSAVTAETNGAFGTGNGALPSGLSAPASADWWHVFLIGKTDGTTKVIVDTDIDCTNGLADTYAVANSYTVYRRIGSVYWDGSKIRQFKQVGDEFYWDEPALDVSVTSGLTGGSHYSYTLAVPTGVKVMSRAVYYLAEQHSPAEVFGYVRDPDLTDASPGSSGSVGSSSAPLANLHVLTDDANGVSRNAHQLEVMTNTSSQIRVTFNTTFGNDFYVNTLGWKDTRGKDG